MTQNAPDSRVREAVGSRREVVNAAFDEELPLAEPQQLYEATRHVIEAGGKRLRPAISLLVGESLADDSTLRPTAATYRSFPTDDGGEFDLLRAALAVEAVQSFTLIHDDIMDEDDLRRGEPAVHAAYDEETAILAGDTLYAKAFELLSSTDAPPGNAVEGINLLASVCTQICEGQALDVAFEERTDVTPDEYMEMVGLKTAVLFGASAAIPARLMGADDAVTDALYRYGTTAGRAFQIADDLLDLTTPSEKLGKQRGSDLVEGKETLVTLHARHQGVDVDGLVATNSVEAVTEAEIEEAVAALRESGSIGYARERADALVEESVAALDVLPDNEPSRLLANTAEYFVSREY